jgi:hypothetical protein
MPDPLLTARIRAQRFWYRDGLTEIVVGVVQLLMSGWLFVSAPSNSRSSWYTPVILIYVLAQIAFAMGAPRIMAAMRERITYPRIGYVQPEESRRKRSLMAAMVAAFLITVTSVLGLRYGGRTDGWDPALWIQWVPAVSGFAIFALLVYVSVRHGLPRFLVVGVLTTVLGAVVSIEYSLRLATTIYLAGLGCALLCSGGVTLWNYLRTTPPSAYGT